MISTQIHLGAQSKECMDSKGKKGFDHISGRKNTWQNEEEVRQAWVSGLQLASGITLDAERIKQDSSYNNVVIEFKSPGAFNGSMSSPKFIEATEDRLTKYIRKRAAKEAIDEEDYIGIAIDGDHLSFAQVQSGHLICQPLMPFSPTAFEMVINALKANFRRAITADNLTEDFGHTSEIGAKVMTQLSEMIGSALKVKKNHKIKMLFQEWETLYGHAADLGIQQRKNINLGFDFSGPAGMELPAKLFVTHTFHSFLLKLIAAEIVAAHGMASSHSLVHDLLAIKDDSDLFAAIRDNIENGRFFTAVGLHGFVEEAIFSWYLDALQKTTVRNKFAEALRALLAKLAVYRFDSVKASQHSRDVLRDFYQDLVPAQLRKSLGEFYTPDWLVEFAVGKLGYSNDDWLSARVLDPTCGSGTFLLELIERKRNAAKEKGWQDEKTVEMLIQTVWGFDLNPLAVQTSRVNFLIALADLLPSLKGKEIEVPVLLADAVYSPARNPASDEKVVKYSIGSNQANLNVVLPADLALDRPLLDKVFQTMSDEVATDGEYPGVETALINSTVLTSEQCDEWRDSLKKTYDQVLALHRKDWNGIWFRIVRNFFWSATAGSFDAVIGNPPWVRWSNLPEAYRERAKPTCESYAIFSDTRFHGGNELDISAMITYTASDKWLKENGKLVFLITQPVFQSPSSQGFRRFHLNESYDLVPLHIDDLKDLSPFPGVANKTAIAMFAKRKRNKIQYPVNYTVWLGRLKNTSNRASDGRRQTRLKTINDRLTLQDALKLVERDEMEATPVSNAMEGAPWAIMKPGYFNACKSLYGSSSWVNGRKGITTDLNGVYFVDIVESYPKQTLVKVRTRPDEGRTNIGGPKTFIVEADSLYPLAKGAGDLQPCYFAPRTDIYTFVPNKGIDKAALQSASANYNHNVNAKTFNFFRAFKPALEIRSTYQGRMKGAPFFAIYNVGDYSFAPYKVVWAEMTGDFCAAVVTKKRVPGVGFRPYVPDHKLYFADFSDASSAYFLCGLLHSEIVKTMIESHLVDTSMGNIFKHVSLPEFDPKAAAHIELARETKAAHKQHNSARRKELVEEIRKLADEIIRAQLKK